MWLYVAVIGIATGIRFGSKSCKKVGKHDLVVESCLAQPGLVAFLCIFDLFCCFLLLLVLVVLVCFPFLWGETIQDGDNRRHWQVVLKWFSWSCETTWDKQMVLQSGWQVGHRWRRWLTLQKLEAKGFSRGADDVQPHATALSKHIKTMFIHFWCLMQPWFGWFGAWGTFEGVVGIFRSVTEVVLSFQGQHEKVAQIFRLADKYGLRRLEIQRQAASCSCPALVAHGKFPRCALVT